MLRPGQIKEIEKLRGYRGIRDRDLGLAGLMKKQAAELKRGVKGLAGIAEAWATIVPPALAERTVLAGLSRGTLTVRVSDAAARYQLEKVLSGGGEAALCQVPGVALRRIKVVCG